MPTFRRTRLPTDARSLKALRRACELRLTDLGLTDHRSAFELGEYLSRSRGRPIQLVAMNLEASHPCGLWVATRTNDFVIYEARTSRPHQEHIIAHELAHMICCHRGVGELDDAGARLLFPDVDPQLVRDMLHRSDYSATEEQEAEMMASLLLQRFVRPPATVEDLPSDAPEIIRIARTIGHASRRDRSERSAGESSR
jgi:hypothetical protein